jgi:DNA-binding IclR family transcriptional regulator
VLSAFDGDHPSLPLGTLARRAGLPLTTTHRLVAELVAGGALGRRPDGQYVIGRLVWALGLLAPVQRELREVALPFCEDLHAATGENVHLAVRDGTRALYVERLHGSRSVPVVARAGARLPLHATGVGKVLLAWAPAPVVDEVLTAPERLTPRTVTEPGRLRRELLQVRARGWATTCEEMTLGSWSVAVPVRSAQGDVVAALGVVGTTSRRGTRSLATALQVASTGITRASR